MKRSPVTSKNVDNFINNENGKEAKIEKIQQQKESLVKPSKKFPIELNYELHSAIVETCKAQGYRTIKDFIYDAIVEKINS